MPIDLRPETTRRELQLARLRDQRVALRKAIAQAEATVTFGDTYTNFARIADMKKRLAAADREWQSLCEVLGRDAAGRKAAAPSPVRARPAVYRDINAELRKRYGNADYIRKVM